MASREQTVGGDFFCMYENFIFFSYFTPLITCENQDLHTSRERLRPNCNIYNYIYTFPHQIYRAIVLPRGKALIDFRISALIIHLELAESDCATSSARKRGVREFHSYTYGKDSTYYIYKITNWLRVWRTFWKIFTCYYTRADYRALATVLLITL